MVAANQERRAFQRYALHNPAFFCVSLADGQMLKIVDLSYGGVGLVSSSESQQPEKLLPPGDLVDVTLNLLGRTCPAQLKSKRTHAGVLGCEFSHSSGETLLFLRGVLEYLRIGQSLEQIPKKFLKERFQAGSWYCFRGDGPSDLFYETADGGRLVSLLLLTFRSGRDYCDTVFQDNKILCRKSSDPSSADSLAVARMSDLAGPERSDIMRSALAVILGYLKGENLNLWDDVVSKLWLGIKS